MATYSETIITTTAEAVGTAADDGDEYLFRSCRISVIVANVSIVIVVALVFVTVVYPLRTIVYVCVYTSYYIWHITFNLGRDLFTLFRFDNSLMDYEYGRGLQMKTKKM